MQIWQIFLLKQNILEENSSNIKKRILQFREIKGIGVENFFSELGLTYGNFKGKSKNSALGSDAIAKISTIYPDLNLDWLITGKGAMLRSFDPEGLLDLGTRVSEIAKSFFKNDFARMASKLSVEYEELFEVIRGDKPPRYALLNQIQQKLPTVNQLWLITGRGEMLKDSLPMQDAIEVGYWEDLVKRLQRLNEQKDVTIAQLTNMLAQRQGNDVGTGGSAGSTRLKAG